MDRRCRRCLYEIERAREPCPECGTPMPLHGWVPDGPLGMQRLPLHQSPVRAWLHRRGSRVPPWIRVPILLLAGAVVGVLVLATVIRLVT